MIRKLLKVVAFIAALLLTVFCNPVVLVVMRVGVTEGIAYFIIGYICAVHLFMYSDRQV